MGYTLNFIAMALLLKDEDTIANFLRENNRFNNMLARLEEAASAEAEFRKADPVITHDFGGTGLGLSITSTLSN
jgi:hypothetical protein